MSRHKEWKIEQQLRWREILRYLRWKNVPVTIREILTAVKAKSTSTIQRDMEAMENEGWVRSCRSPDSDIASKGNKYRRHASWCLNQDSVVAEKVGGGNRVPLIGTIGAGSHIPELEYHGFLTEEWIATHLEEVHGLVALAVKGNSMIDAGVFNGDKVVILPQQDWSSCRPGDMAAVLVSDDSGEHLMLKHIFRNTDDTFRLVSANPGYKDKFYHVSKVKLKGKVVDIIRMLNRPAKPYIG